MSSDTQFLGCLNPSQDLVTKCATSVSFCEDWRSEQHIQVV